MRLRPLLLMLCFLSGSVLAGTRPVAAQPVAFDPVSVIFSQGEVQIAWAAPQNASKIDLASSGWPSLTFGALGVPAQLVAVQLPNDTALDLQITHVASTPWQGKVAELAVQQAANSDLTPAVDQLPHAPVVVLREGRMRGTHIVVLAVNALFEQGGAARRTLSVAATIPNAQPFVATTSELLATPDAFISAAPAPNAQANQAAVLLRVAHVGMQQVSGAALASAGLSLNGLDPTRLHLRVRGAEVALELRGTDDGRLDPGDELRFFAGNVGDRWNSSDTYWLSVEATPGLRMASRMLGASGAPARSTALERGEWRGTQIYNPSFPGPHGDHWFSGRLTAGPGSEPMALGMPLTPTLALATGTTVLTVTGSAQVLTNHTLAVTLGGTTQQDTWSSRGDWARRFSFTTNDVTTTVALLPGAQPDRLDIDSVAWERPVALDLGGRGASFAGVTGDWSYQLSNVPVGATLYDVSNAQQPALLATAPGGSWSFADGPTAHSYLLAGSGTLFTPAVSAHQPVDLATRRDADVVLIAPALFHSELQPLVDLRASQGHRVAVIDTQAIYDGWSYGQIDPTAIRSFLRYAAATWQPAPSAVTLIGDGTYDPRNYTRRNNIPFVPPYLAPVDPYQGIVGLSVGETACETCYAQLDGDDPLSDTLPDLALGRLPVKSVDELAKVIAKMTSYERTPPPGFWRSRMIVVADNATDAEGQPDPAGDFFAFAEQSIAQQPQGISSERVYYDPNPKTNGQTGHIADPMSAFQRNKAALSSGALFVTYTGHSNEYQWAVTDLAATPSYLLGLYDTDALTNGSQLPVVLEMTCLTGAFHTPAFSGTTLDERFVLNPYGGAIATWSPTGKGVAVGHDTLQKGFYGEFWRRFAAGQPAPLGALTLAGYTTLFTQGTCCQDALRTFALLGDPLTVPQARFGGEVFLPSIQH